MAKELRGQATFKIDGTAYRMSYSFNAIAEIEDVLDDTMDNIVARLQDPKGIRISLARTVFWGGLLDHHPEITVKEAGAIMTRLGIVRSLELVAEAINRSFPEPSDRPLLEPEGKGKRKVLPGLPS